jgi:hypothetical protein
MRSARVVRMADTEINIYVARPCQSPAGQEIDETHSVDVGQTELPDEQVDEIQAMDDMSTVLLGMW